MCSARLLDRRSRLTLAIGNLCLFTGLSISLWATDFARQHHGVFNGLRFGLLSLAISVNFHAMRSARGGNNGNL